LSVYTLQLERFITVTRSNLGICINYHQEHSGIWRRDRKRNMHSVSEK